MDNDQTSSLDINSLPLLSLKIKISNSHYFEDSNKKKQYYDDERTNIKVSFITNTIFVAL